MVENGRSGSETQKNTQQTRFHKVVIILVFCHILESGCGYARNLVHQKDFQSEEQRAWRIMLSSSSPRLLSGNIECTFFSIVSRDLLLPMEFGG